MISFPKLAERLLPRLDNLATSASDPSFWALDSLKIDLYDNQIEICDAVCDLNVKYLAILQSRGSGKTFSVGLGLVKLCIDNPKISIGVFGPKADQAARIIKEIKHNIIDPTSPVYSAIDWKESTNARLVFFNGSEMLAMSAAEATMSEGWHFHILVIDEAHRVSDTSVNQRLLPMLGSLPIGKIIKLGISMYRNNFWKSCCSPGTPYRVLRRDWTQCPILLSQGVVSYNGMEYSRYIIDQMPLSLKVKMFPDRPELHYDGAMTEIDFKTQYAMEWVQDINLVLSEEDQRLLLSGDFDILGKARVEYQDVYYFGLDTAGGTLLPGRKDLDFTVLSIWRKRGDNVKEAIARFEWQGNVVQQVEEIETIIHPKTGIFPCAFGLADYSNIAIGIVENFKQKGIPIEGITFNATEPSSHKNYKNAMFDQFKLELQSGRVRYPSLEKIEKSVIFKKAFNEWCNLERHTKLGINADIKAPSDFHDDHCCADVLAVFSMDHMVTFQPQNVKTKLPTPQIGASTSPMKGIMGQPGQQKGKSRFLP